MKGRTPTIKLILKHYRVIIYIINCIFLIDIVNLFLMSLFQKSVLTEYLKSITDDEINSGWEKIQDYQKISLNKIKEFKEEVFQATFLTKIFVDCLGYKSQYDTADEGNLFFEEKNISDSKKADGAIKQDGKVVGVIELKSTKTKNLEQIKDQAFIYQSSHDCNYVVSSNFEKLRFYINTSSDYEEFNLFNLDKESFRFLYLCLSKESIFNNIPKKIKEKSLGEEEKVTKKLYSDYSSFRTEVFNNLINSNKEYDKLLLFNKTQKLLDRFLFIFFGEDRHLIPANSIGAIINKWEEDNSFYGDRTLFEVFKGYFNVLNVGRPARGEKQAIFAYNGGLFAEDEILNKLKIDDNILLKHTKNLSHYDFESEISVNILGHIFEHSLSEIEEIQNEITGSEIGTSKRKKDGVFYTPKYITKYIVDNTVGKLCVEKKSILKLDQDFDIVEYQKSSGGVNKKGEKLFHTLESYKKWLLELKIVDPACGSGAFLNEALSFLIREHKEVDDLIAELTNTPLRIFDTEKSILENNIYGVDINEESVEIAKLSMWLRTAQKGRQLSNLSNNIKCGNSLIDDPEIAGDKAFSWESEFPAVFEKGGFDVVIGNPPYVFARDNFSQEIKNYYSNNYVSAEYQINLYLLFIERSISLIKEKANYGLIIPNAWLMVDSAKGLRNLVLKSSFLDKIINLAGYSFEGINVETIIILATKSKEEKLHNNVDVFLSAGKEFRYSHKRKQIDFEKNEGFEFKVFSDETSLELTRKLRNGSEDLDNLVQIKAGLQAYEKNKGEPKQSIEDVKSRPYDFKYKFDENTHKYLEGRDVGRYFINWSGRYLKYGDNLFVHANHLSL